MHPTFTLPVRRKRSLRCLLWGVAAAAATPLLPCAEALSAATTSRRRLVSPTPGTLTPGEAAYDNPYTPTYRFSDDVYQEDGDGDDDDEELEGDIDWWWEPSDDHANANSRKENLVQALQDLQQSTGPEVTNETPKSQEQMMHQLFFGDDDTTDMERIAMRSVTEQLPQAAVQALEKRQPQRQRQRQPHTKNLRSRTNNEDMQFSTLRVTPQQEVVLAQAIQSGSRLQSLKRDAEAKSDRTLTKAEWAAAAQLTPKELRRQIARYRQAKHVLVQANMGLVHAVVNQQWARQQNTGNARVTKEEMIQEGSLGLLRAAELFDPDQGLRFSTYAVVWIKGVLRNSHVRELVRLPAREKSKWHKICRATQELQQSHAGSNGQTNSHHHQPTWEEVAAATGYSVADVLATTRHMQSTQSVASLDAPRKLHSRGGAASTDVTTEVVDPEEEALVTRTQLHADLVAALARTLTPRQARLMRLRYGLSDGVARSLAECADAMGLSRTRVQQLNQQCLQTLRAAAEVESLQEYLLTIA